MKLNTSINDLRLTACSVIRKMWADDFDRDEKLEQLKILKQYVEACIERVDEKPRDE